LDHFILPFIHSAAQFVANLTEYQTELYLISLHTFIVTTILYYLILTS